MIATREMGSYYLKGEAEDKPGEAFVGGGERALNGDDAYGRFARSKQRPER